MSPIRSFLAALVLMVGLSGSATAGWGFSYHSYAPHYDYHCHGPVCAPYYGGHVHHYCPAPYVPQHHHLHGPPRAAFFFGF
jgi:hypothetical protein